MLPQNKANEDKPKRSPGSSKTSGGGALGMLTAGGCQGKVIDADRSDALDQALLSLLLPNGQEVPHSTVMPSPGKSGG